MSEPIYKVIIVHHAWRWVMPECKMVPCIRYDDVDKTVPFEVKPRINRGGEVESFDHVLTLLGDAHTPQDWIDAVMPRLAAHNPISIMRALAKRGEG